MSLRYSEQIRNAGLDARIAAIGDSAQLRIFGAGKKLLVTIPLPKPWMTKAEKGLVHKKGTWQALAEQKGEATSFCICDGAGTAHMTGEIPVDMTLDNPNVEKGQSVMVGTFVIAAGNGV